MRKALGHAKLIVQDELLESDRASFESISIGSRDAMYPAPLPYISRAVQRMYVCSPLFPALPISVGATHANLVKVIVIPTLH